eukprot:778420-Prorocentrum_lima.AAC.1
MDTNDELNQMTARSDTSNERHSEPLDPVQAWFESTVKEKEPQPTTTPCSLGLGLLPRELPPAESVSYKVKKEG